MNFMDALKSEANSGKNNLTRTENGALGFRTTGKALLDLNYAVSSLRTRDSRDIEAMFAAACAENLNLALTWLFFARDIRGIGMGERRLFRVCMLYAARNFPEKTAALLKLIPEYGRWDDLVFIYFETTEPSVKKAAFEIIAAQLNEDLKALAAGKSVSLLSKWLPSENTSSQVSRREARHLAMMLGVAPKQYRQRLSALRKQIDIVERRMSGRDWGGIDYEAVPSKANLLYRDAFMEHDPERRRQFLDSLKKDPKKIKASVLFPHEIVSAYVNSPRVDATLEALWKNLPNVFSGEAPRILVVADGSGSMTWGPGNVRPIDVANALAIYFAERLPEPYHDRYITFSSRPQYVELSGANTLRDRINIAEEHDECANTNIKATFDLILDTAVKNHLKQDELPETVLILSDGEFDSMSSNADATTFEIIRREYAAMGYQLPKLCFWNICSRTLAIPVTENDRGVCLVSGFSPAVVKMVMSGELDPYKALLSSLADPRYLPVVKALEGECSID